MGQPKKNTKVTLCYGAGVALTLRCSCGSTQLSVNATPEPQRTGQRNGVDLEFEVKYGKPWGTQEQHKNHTSTGRKIALVEGLSHDLVCAGSIYHVHFAWQVWHGQYSPHFKFNKLKSFSRGEIDQNHVDKRILGGEGLQYEDSTSITFVRPVYAWCEILQKPHLQTLHWPAFLYPECRWHNTSNQSKQIPNLLSRALCSK